MKTIMIMFDSLNRHMLPNYGCDWVKAPNFQRLAKRSITFDNSYIGSMPCMPARREIHTGRLNFLHRSWGPLEPYDVSMPQLLKENGIYSHLISDHQHYWEDGGCTYHPRYNSWEIVRGQEGDPWKGQVADPVIPEHLGQFWRHDAVNRSYITTEEEQPQTQTFDLGVEFIQKNMNEDDWFLQIETFDPHEPFMTMDHYQALYPHTYNGPQFDWPDYRPIREDERDTIEHIRYMNAALISMCDHNLGKIIDMMDANNLWDDTMLIVNTDHGFLLGEHDYWAKITMPFYQEIAHTPFFVWDPRVKIADQRRKSLVSTIDIAPTVLDFFNIPIPEEVQGKSIKPILENDTPIREALLFGMFGGHVNCTDGEYVYMKGPETPANLPLFEYTLMPTHMRSMFSTDELQDIQLAKPFDFTKGCSTMRIPSRGPITPINNLNTLLYNVKKDEKQTTIITDSAITKMMESHLITLMKENDAPIEQYIRLGINP